MRWALGISGALIASGALMLIQGSIIKDSQNTLKAFVGDNKSNLENTVRGIYNPAVVASKGSLDFNLKSNLVMYDSKKNQLIFSNDVKTLAQDSVDLLTTIKVTDSDVSIFNKDINHMSVNVVQKEKDKRYYEEDTNFSNSVIITVDEKLKKLNADPKIPKKMKQRSRSY